MMLRLSFVLVLVASSSYVEAFQLANGGHSSNQGQLFASSELSNAVDTSGTPTKDSDLPSKLPDTLAFFSMMLNFDTLLFPDDTPRAGNDTDNVPITFSPFNIYLESIRDLMPTVTMEVPLNNFNIAISKTRRFQSPYTPVDFVYPSPRASRAVPTMEEVYENPRMMKGFDAAYAHPANREVALRIVEIGREVLKRIRAIPPLRAPDKGTPGIPIEIQEHTITIDGYPYGDSSLTVPSCNFLMNNIDFV